MKKNYSVSDKSGAYRTMTLDKITAPGAKKDTVKGTKITLKSDGRGGKA